MRGRAADATTTAMMEEELVGIGPRPKIDDVVLDDDLSAAIGDVQGEFRWQALRMPRLSRYLLLNGAAPSSVCPEALFKDLHLAQDVEAAARCGLVSASAVLRRTAILPPAACARLRAAVDAERQQHCDTVDQAPDNQLNLSAERLEALIYDASASAAMWKLPAEFAAQNSEPIVSADDAQIFVRQYAASSRPWNPFHTDSSALTINIALAGDCSFDGGHLLACFDGAVRRVVRDEGDASVHASTLLHGVSLMTSGVRYSLIIFAGGKGPDAAVGLAGDPLDVQAEADALAALMADRAFLARCDAVCAAGTASVLSVYFERLQTLAGGDDHALGTVIEKVVDRFGAPHLQPTLILPRAALADAAADACMRDAACWSLRALLHYANELTGND